MTKVVKAIKAANKLQDRKEIDQQLKLFRHFLSKTNCRHRGFFSYYKTARNLLFERKFEELSLFETILETPGMKELIELVFELSDTLKNEYILQTVRFTYQ